MATTICTCVEPGPLEQQVCLLFESLRAFGGALAKAPAVAVQPRKGLAISSATRRKLAALDIDYVKIDRSGRHSWYANLNKSAAMSWVEENVDTTFVTWLDGDMVILRDIAGLLPDDEFGFAARAGEGYFGTDGEDDNAPFWARVSSLTGVSFRDGEKIEAIPDGREIFEYYQGGAYTARRSEGVCARQFNLMKAVIDAQIASEACGTFHYDQLTLALAARKTSRPRRRLPWALNYNFNLIKEEAIDRERLRECRILHYHGSFYPENFSRAARYFDELPDEPRRMIEAHAPLSVGLGPAARLARKALSTYRARKAERHARLAEVI